MYNHILTYRLEPRAEIDSRRDEMRGTRIYDITCHNDELHAFVVKREPLRYVAINVATDDEYEFFVPPNGAPSRRFMTSCTQ